MSDPFADLPPLRGPLRRDVPLAPLTWLRVGGPAEALFQPADVDDLAAFLAALPPAVPVTPMGVASSTPSTTVLLGRSRSRVSWRL